MEKRVIAIASGGGHWKQLMLMRPGFDAHRVAYVTTLPGLAEQSQASPAFLVPDCNRNEPIAVARCAFAILGLMIRHRPDVVVSTGAMPGLLALAVGKLFGSRTVWIDSVANAEEMSASGRLAGRFADLWLSQWEHVARKEGADYLGSVL